MNNPKVILVGCGNMGRALLDGWLARGLEPTSIFVVEPDNENRRLVEERSIPTGVDVDAIDASVKPQAVVLAVKPQQLGKVVGDYQRFTDSALVISVAAGTRH